MLPQTWCTYGRRNDWRLHGPYRWRIHPPGCRYYESNSRVVAEICVDGVKHLRWQWEVFAAVGVESTLPFCRALTAVSEAPSAAQARVNGDFFGNWDWTQKAR